MNAAHFLAIPLIALAACGNPPGETGEANRSSEQAAADQQASDKMAADVTAGTQMAAGQAGAGGQLDPATYVANAASGDMYEIASSQLAVKTSKNEATRTFAQRMITDHQATTAQLRTIATGSGMTLPTEMQPQHAQMLAQLTSAAASGGEAFDRLYREQQMTAHAEAIALHRGMANRADLPADLAGFARQTLPKVEGHHGMLMEMPGGTATPAG